MGTGARVHFYTHEMIELTDPARAWGTRVRRWLVRKVSPRFGHCAIESNGLLYELVYYGGYAISMTQTQQTREANSVSLDVQATIRVQLRSISPARMVLAYFFPRKFDNCSSYVGRMVGCLDARTPDELYELLIDYHDARAV